jgi:membrane associated rhomboid family serine protease
MDDGRSAQIAIAEARKALWVMVGFIALIWVVQIPNALEHYALSQEFGIHSLDAEGLLGIVTAPFLHFSWAHIEGNSGPLFIFGFLAAYRGVSKFFGVTALIAVISGVGAWALSGPGTVTAGASGVVFGYFGYVLVRGAFDRHLIDIVIGLVMALCFAYQFTGLLPHEGISWQGHGFGFLAGILGGWLFRDRRPASRPAAGGGNGTAIRPAGGGGPAVRPAPPAGSRAALHKELDDLGL